LSPVINTQYGDCTLISTLGLSPAVVTEAIDALRADGLHPRQIYLVTTNHPDIHRVCLPLIRRELKRYRPKSRLYVIRFPFEDIVTEDDHIRFMKVSSAKLAAIRRSAAPMIVSIAGGRKTMSILLALTAQAIGADRIIHLAADPSAEMRSRRALAHPEAWMPSYFSAAMDGRGSKSAGKTDTDKLMHPSGIKLVSLPAVSLPLIISPIRAWMADPSRRPSSADIQTAVKLGLIHVDASGTLHLTDNGKSLLNLSIPAAAKKAALPGFGAEERLARMHQRGQISVMDPLTPRSHVVSSSLKIPSGLVQRSLERLAHATRDVNATLRICAEAGMYLSRLLNIQSGPRAGGRNLDIPVDSGTRPSMAGETSPMRFFVDQESDAVPLEWAFESGRWLALCRPIGRTLIVPEASAGPRRNPVKQRELLSLGVFAPPWELTSPQLIHNEARLIADTLRARRIRVSYFSQFPSPSALSEWAARHDAIHFCGHARIEKNTVWIPYKSGRMTSVSSLFSGPRQKLLFFFNACSKNSVPIKLLNAVDAIVPMGDIPEPSASAFAVEFYRQLSNGLSVGASVWRARYALFRRRIPTWLLYKWYGPGGGLFQ